MKKFLIAFVLFQCVFTLSNAKEHVYSDRFLTPPKASKTGEVLDEMALLRHEIVSVRKKAFIRWKGLMNGWVQEEYAGEMMYLEGRWIALTNVLGMMDQLYNTARCDLHLSDLDDKLATEIAK